jgi:urea transport system substrate-binding protein
LPEERAGHPGDRPPPAADPATNGSAPRGPDDGIRIGILYSLSGGLAGTETSISRGALLAVDQVNAAGGVRGRPLVPLLEDYASDMSLAATRARKLLRADRVVACIGGYTSASRVAMLPVIATHGSLLIYPTYYEGMEQDGNVIYAGAVPNQFLLDYMDWIFAHLGRRIYMVGSDYVYPRTLGTMIRRIARAAGADVIADRYVPLGCETFAPVIEEIGALRPEVVISNVVGSDSVPAFYREFRAAGHTAATLPIAATVTTEIELQTMGPEVGAGHFMIGTYFGSLANPVNQRYVAAFRARFGADAVTHVAQVGAYNAVWLFARAAGRARDLSLPALREAFVGTTFEDNPEGRPITVHPDHHTDHPCYIGCARADGQFDVLAEFPPRSPEPYPSMIVPERNRPIGPDYAARR